MNFGDGNTENCGSSKLIRWCAIGDSFTYLNDHMDETGHRVATGYMTQACRYFREQQIREQQTREPQIRELEVLNIGMNGSTTNDWLTVELPEADIYTVLLGTNDWHQGIPLGTGADFKGKTQGTILGNLAVILDHIRQASPVAPILVLNPVERGDFVYILDPLNNAHGSYAEDQGQWLADIADGIYQTCLDNGICAMNLHDLCGFTPENAVKFKRVRTADGYRNLPYPEYVGLPIDYENEEYPYPPEAANLTYDGLHPSELGNRVIGELVAAGLRQVLGDAAK